MQKQRERERDLVSDGARHTCCVRTLFFFSLCLRRKSDWTEDGASCALQQDQYGAKTAIRAVIAYVQCSFFHLLLSQRCASCAAMLRIVAKNSIGDALF